MKSKINQHNIVLSLAILAFLLCALFFSIYTTELLSNKTQVKSKEYSGMENKNFTLIARTTKEKVNADKVDSVNDPNEESTSKKMYFNNLTSLKNRWSLSILILLIMLSLCIFLQYIKEWLLKVIQAKIQLSLVHFIQLKDGKEYALYYRFSI